MPHCQTFKQKIEELKKRIQSLGALSIEELLLKYRNTGDEKIAEELYRILQEIEEFKKEYEEKVKELLIEWYPKKENIELDLSYCNLSGTLYIPSLFEKIEVLDCSYNQITSLPKLPNGLKDLNCSHNKLTSLPELPDGLKRLSCYNNKPTSLPELPAGLQWLNCFHNPLSPETIQKIKSHPNYNIHTWLI
jgi:Leucine-rich repeat (LRR) protein